ncbi:MAG: DNA (cytosine-5-)-methyltransferase [Armatimonadota bacterium]|nr:DNA (cytosine-5-)-methyltransferase [Armatimonadota bacterium]
MAPVEEHKASVVDLFCGIGGLTHGFVKEGFKVVAGIDDDPTCKYAFEKNNGATFIRNDIDLVKPEDVIRLYPKDDVKILVGCAPCQPFSRYTNRKSEDGKWKLLASFSRLIRGVRPDIVSMENVPELEKHCVFSDFLKVLDDEHYHVSYSLVDCVAYGVPQTRTRLVLFASLLGNVRIMPKTHGPSRYRTVRDAIGHLEPIKAGEQSASDSLHKSSTLSGLNLKRIAATPPGGGWKDWPDELILDCHKKESGKSYPSVYGRIRWDDPGPTITTQCHGLGNGRFGHPEQNRAISLREAALLQTFPRYYKLAEPRSDIVITSVARHVGNAVPVRLGRIIARSIKKHMEAHSL